LQLFWKPSRRKEKAKARPEQDSYGSLNKFSWHLLPKPKRKLHYEPFSEAIRRAKEGFLMAKTDLFGLKSSDSWQRQELGRLHIDYY